jgi:hypothetical protein
MPIQLKQLLLEADMDALKKIPAADLKTLNKIKKSSTSIEDFLQKAKIVGLGLAAATIIYVASHRSGAESPQNLPKLDSYMAMVHNPIKNADQIKWYTYGQYQITFDQVEPVPKDKNGEECRIGDMVSIAMIDDTGHPEDNDVYYVAYGNRQLTMMRITGYVKFGNEDKLSPLIAVGNGKNAPIVAPIRWLTISHKEHPEWIKNFPDKVVVGKDTNFTVPTPPNK